MGFLKSVVKVVSAPVTVPLKITSNIIRETGEALGVEKVTAPLSTLAAAPYSALQKGEGVEQVLPGVVNAAKELAPIASSVAAGVPALAGAGVGQSILTGLQGLAPSQLAKAAAPEPEMIATPSTPMIYEKTDFTMPVLIGIGVIAFIYLARR